MKNIRWILPLLLLGIFAAGARADVVTCIVIPGSACNQITSPTLGPNTWVTPPDTESVDPAEKILLVFNSAFSGPPGLYTILDASGTVSDIVFVGNVLGHGTVELISDPLPEDLATWTEVTIGCTENAVTGCTFNFQVSVAGDGTYLVTAGSDGDPQFDPAGFRSASSKHLLEKRLRQKWRRQFGPANVAIDWVATEAKWRQRDQPKQAPVNRDAAREQLRQWQSGAKEKLLPQFGGRRRQTSEMAGGEFHVLFMQSHLGIVDRLRHSGRSVDPAVVATWWEEQEAPRLLCCYDRFAVRRPGANSVAPATSAILQAISPWTRCRPVSPGTVAVPTLRAHRQHRILRMAG